MVFFIALKLKKGIIFIYPDLKKILYMINDNEPVFHPHSPKVVCSSSVFLLEILHVRVGGAIPEPKVNPLCTPRRNWSRGHHLVQAGPNLLPLNFKIKT